MMDYARKAPRGSEPLDQADEIGQPLIARSDGSRAGDEQFAPGEAAKCAQERD
jgi:hypothetical protein